MYVKFVWAIQPLDLSSIEHGVITPPPQIRNLATWPACLIHLAEGQMDRAQKIVNFQYPADLGRRLHTPVPYKNILELLLAQIIVQIYIFLSS